MNEPKHWTRTLRRRLQTGFTLVELMVVVVIIGILAAIGLPMYQNYVLIANVKQALPYLTNIAAKNRIHYNRTGRYLATLSEQEIQSRLGIDLSNAADFCFMAFCTDSAKCGAYTGTNNALQSETVGSLSATPEDSPATEFQIVGVLRAGTAATVASANLGTCTNGTIPEKLAPQGWVRAPGAGEGAQGRVVVLSYPPPVDAVGNIQAINGRNGVSVEWSRGITITDAIR